jgi:hypothetical protein
VEYYSYLRPCVPLAEATAANSKTFITYEGTKENGFQLRTYVLLTDAAGAQYFFRDQAELDQMTGDCTAQRYKDGVRIAGLPAVQ